MYSKSKRIVCFLLCFLILFVGFADVLTAPAKAEPITIAASASVLIWILGLMGITFATLEGARQAVEGVMWNAPDIMDMVDGIVANNGGGDGGSSPPNADLLFNALTLSHLSQIMSRLKEIFSAEGYGEMEFPSGYYTLADFPDLIIHDFTDVDTIFVTTYDMCDYFFPYTSQRVLFEAEKNGVLYRQSVFHGSFSGNNGLFLRLEGSSSHNFYLGFSEGYEENIVGYGFAAVLQNGSPYLVPYFGLRYRSYSGEVLFKTSFLQRSFDGYPLFDTPLDAATVKVPYKSEPKYSPSQIIGAINDRIGGSGPFTVTIPQATEDTIKKGQDDILADIDIKDSLEDGGGTVTPDPPYPDEEFDIDKNKMPQSLVYKFPFCVPFDLIDIIQALNAEPQAPRFVVPLVNDTLDFEYDIVIDFAPFEPIALVCRWVCILSFLVFLSLTTRKLIKG